LAYLNLAAFAFILPKECVHHPRCNAKQVAVSTANVLTWQICRANLQSTCFDIAKLQSKCFDIAKLQSKYIAKLQSKCFDIAKT